MGLFDRYSKKNKSEETEAPQDNNLNLDYWFWSSFLMNEAKFQHQYVSVKRSSKDEPEYPLAFQYFLPSRFHRESQDLSVCD